MISFKDVLGQISLTFDAWTSKSFDPYLAITGHWIEAPKNKPNNWELKSELLGFTEIQGNHGGANIASVILRIVDRYDIRKKVCVIFFLVLISNVCFSGWLDDR
jgi:hypothetical protein